MHTGSVMTSTQTLQRRLRLAATFATAASLAIALSSCGGGGGGETTPPAPPPPAPAPAPGTDTQAPSVTVSNPAQLSSGLVGTVDFNVLATDDVAVTSVEFQVDGQTVSTRTTLPWQASIATAAHASGQHVLRARARDAAGNLSPWAAVTVRFGGDVGVTQGFTKNEAWASGLANATAFAVAADGRVFVAQQGGALRVVKGGVLQPTAFANVTVDSTGERGLIGVALHPNFATNGFVYLHYTTISGGTHNRISRFVATAPGSDVSSGAETVLVDLPALSGATNHNGGALHFGTDGKLYVGVGDNADGAKAQNLAHPFGKLLRFNDDGSIPADNPFAGAQVGLARAVWAYGLRNPFTFAVQPGSGRIHVNDVGQDTWEEINVGAAGANYGWPGSEGPDRIGAGVTAPLFAYGHAEASPAGSGAGGFFTGFAIAGGAFYPDSGNYPASYRGNYFFADFATRFIARLDATNGNAAYSFARVAGSPVDLRVAPDGALLVLTRSAITRISSP